MVKLTDNEWYMLDNMNFAPIPISGGYQWHACKTLVDKGLAEVAYRKNGSDRYTITPAGRAWLAEKEKEA